MRFLVLVFSLFISVHAFAETCERVLGADRFALDQPTVNDLKLTQLVEPVVGKYISTDLGLDELRWQLNNPLLRSDEIRLRQQAIQALVENTELRQSLKTSLEEISSKLGDLMPKFLKELAQRHNGSSAMWTRGVSLGGMTLLATAAFSTVTDIKASSDYLALAVPFLIVGARFQDRLMFSRERIRPLQPVFKLASQNHQSLQDLPPSLLQELGRTFSAASDPAHPSSVARVNKNVHRMWNGTPEYLAALVFSLPATTYNLRKLVVDKSEEIGLLLQAVGRLDVLVAMAELVVQSNGQYVFPKILDEDHPTYIKIVEGHHPYILAGDGLSTANSVKLGEKGTPNVPPFLLLTGPNTGGKSTYLKMIAILTALAQIGAPVPAQSMTLTPVALMTNMTVQDSVEKGQSFFAAQGARVATILDRAKLHPHVLIIMDEILTGTSPEEHTAAEQAIIKYLVKKGYVSILATHDRKLQALEQTIEGLQNIHVDDKAADTYAIKPGPSLHRNAIQVLREVGLPAEITDEAEAFLGARP